MQVSGHIKSPDGKKMMALGGKWNEYLDCQRCDEEGDPLPDAPKTRLWTVSSPSLQLCNVTLLLWLASLVQIPSLNRMAGAPYAMLHCEHPAALPRLHT